MTRMMQCVDCEAIVAYRHNARYCLDCAAKHGRARQARWAREHPQRRDPIAAAGRVSALRENGLMRSDRARSADWMADDPPDLLWIVRVRIPFTQALSKNHMWSLAKGGHGNTYFMNRETRQAREVLALHVKRALGDQQVVEARLWIDILVQKDSHRGDAVNFVDEICDAIQDATGLNDRWYSIRRLDWQIVKQDPAIFVGIGQDTDTPILICSYCARELPREAFGNNRSTRTGASRVCLECSRVTDGDRRSRKRADASA